MSAVFAIDMLALYWLSLVLHSAEPAIVGLSPCWVLSIQKYCYRYASSLFPCWRYCTLSSLLSLVCRPAGAVYSEVLLSPCWLSISLLVILHSAERAIVRLSFCRNCLFSCIAIDMLAFYWLALVLHSAEPAIVRLSPAGYAVSKVCIL